ncbi:MAG TPA: hypothetical protein VFM33_02740 [Aquabacterium sp.]|nr:hypothetical protein [Aquabacterium sp.]
MTTQSPIPELDALPLLPQKPGQARFMTFATTSFHSSKNAGHWYSPDAVREIVAAELRKAQEGREPVGVVYTMQALSSLEFDGGPPKCHVSLYEDLPAGTKLYTSPPPKSDEARDAERWRMADLINRESNMHPDSRKHQAALSAYRDSIKSGLCFASAIDAALAAQQKGYV